MKKRRSIKVILTSLITSLMLVISALVPVNAAQSQIVTNVTTTQKVIALTFDDGDGVYAETIVSILKSYNVKATFFFTGWAAAAAPDLLRTIVANGNVVGNHSYSHPYLDTLTDEQIRDEIQSAEDTIRNITGVSTIPYFRPPYGNYDDRVLRIAAELGYPNTYYWSIDTADWSGIEPQAIIDTVLNNAAPGAIVLMHTGNETTRTKDALPTIITSLRDQGYTFVTIPELMTYHQPAPITMPATLTYSSHVQSIGWQSYVSDGVTSGTTGSGLRLEALKIDIDPGSYTGTIEYRAHVQSYGWQDWVTDNQVSGTTGLAKRLEAIQINLTGSLGQYYDVVYRTYIQNYGWLDWAKNGESSGSATYGYRMEAIEVKLVPKGTFATGADTFMSRNLKYNAHVQSIGWQTYRLEGDVAGTIGLAKRLEAYTLSLTNMTTLTNVDAANSGITYRSHIQNIGWQTTWSSNGQISGTTGQSLRLEAIQIMLTGDIATKYDVIYRVHVQSFGWLGWAINGGSAGTEGYGYRMEAFEIRLVPKGSLTTDPSAAFKTI